MQYFPVYSTRQYFLWYAAMGFEPSPFIDLYPTGAFEAANADAQQVVNTATRELPAGVPSQFIDTLEQVRFTAEDLIETVNTYNGELSPGGIVAH